MDRRLALALLLSGLAVIVSSMLFPPAQRRASVPPRASDSVAALRRSEVVTDTATIRPQVSAEPAVQMPADMITLQTQRAIYQFSTRGAAPVGVTLRDYRALNRDSGSVRLVRDGTQLLSYRVVAGRDTLSLNQFTFAADAFGSPNASDSIVFRGTTPLGDIVLVYGLDTEGYVLALRGQLPPSATELIITIPRGLRSEEANVADDRRYFAFALQPLRDDARSVDFSKLDSAEIRRENGPFTWVASKNKYFLVSLLTPERGAPFPTAYLVGAPRERGAATSADVHVVVPAERSTFSVEV